MSASTSSTSSNWLVPYMPDYAGVLAFRDDRIALIRERYEGWDAEHWNTPSGAIEPGESPETAALRELQEETGLIALPHQLTLVAEVLVVSRDRSIQSRAWNYRADIPTGDFQPTDPSTFEVRWFPIPEAIALLEELSYPPRTHPALAYLRQTAPTPAHWTFTFDQAMPFNTRTYEINRAGN